VLTEDRRCRVTGQQMNESEQDDRQPEQNRHGTDKSSDDVSQHGRAITDALRVGDPGSRGGSRDLASVSRFEEPRAEDYLSSQTEFNSSVRLPEPTKPFT
jgi:hypothetical protein